VLSNASAKTIYVSKEGSDGNDGSSEAKALATFAKAVEKLVPGDIMRILPGEYVDKIFLDYKKINGTQDKPITIEGTDRNKVIIKGENKFDPIPLFSTSGSDYIHVKNLTFHTGQKGFLTWSDKIAENREIDADEVFRAAKNIISQD